MLSAPTLSHTRVVFLCDYVALEARQKVRVVCENDAFLALVPFWAVWPFEILVCSRRHFGNMNEFAGDEARSLSQILHRDHFHLRQGFRDSLSLFDGIPPVADRWHRPSGVPFPRALFSATAALGDGPQAHGRLRNAGTPQRDITPESAAERLRALAKPLS